MANRPLLASTCKFVCAMAEEALACTHPLVDHAIVVGANTTLELDGTTPRGSGIFECSYVPRILFEYPPSRPLDAKVAVAAFCLPSALRLARVRRPPHFACFVLTLSDGSRMYGHCMTIHELVGAATEVVLPPREVPAGWRECADGALVRLAEEEGEAAPAAAAPPAAGSTRKLLSELLHHGSACYAPRCMRSMSPGAACGCATARQPCLGASTSSDGSGAHSGGPASLRSGLEGDSVAGPAPGQPARPMVRMPHGAADAVQA